MKAAWFHWYFVLITFSYILAHVALICYMFSAPVSCSRLNKKDLYLIHTNSACWRRIGYNQRWFCPRYNSIAEVSFKGIMCVCVLIYFPWYTPSSSACAIWLYSSLALARSQSHSCIMHLRSPENFFTVGRVIYALKRELRNVTSRTATIVRLRQNPKILHKIQQIFISLERPFQAQRNDAYYIFIANVERKL